MHNKVIENYITDVRRFYMLGYIDRQEAHNMAGDIEGVLKSFEKACITGRLENGKEMEIYCTDLYFSSDLYIVESDRINFAMLQPNPVNPILTKSPKICETMLTWFKLWKQTSSLISCTGIHIRQEFMERQYRVLNDFRTFIGD